MLQDLLPFALYQWGRLHLYRRNGYGAKESENLLRNDSIPWRGLENLKILRNGTLSSFTDKAIVSIHPIRSTPTASDPNSLVLLNLRDNEVSKISNTTLTFLHLSADSDPTELTVGNDELDGDFSLLYASDMDPTSGSVTLLLKAELAIFFYTYAKSDPNTISYLAADYIFSRNKYHDNDPNYLMVADKFTSQPDWVALFARIPNASGSGNKIEIYALCQAINPKSDYQFCDPGEGGVTIPPALYETFAVWTTRAGSAWPGLLWGMDGENSLVGYNLDVDPTPMVMVEKERITLPVGITSNVTRVELMAVDDKVDYLLVHLGDAGDVLAFKSEGGQKFVPELVLFGGDNGGDSELLTEAGETLISASKGPLITQTDLAPPFSLKSTHPAQFIWKGSPLARVHSIPLSGKDGPVVILGNSEEGGVNWVVAQPETVGRSPYIPSLRESLSYIAPSNLTLPHLPFPSFRRIIETNPTTPSIIAPIPSSTFINALNIQKGKVELSLMLIPEIGFRVDYSGGAMRPPKKSMDVPLIGEGGWNSRRPTWIGMDPGSGASRWDASYFLILNYKVYPLKETTVWDDYSEDTDPTKVTRTFVVKPSKTKDQPDDHVITYREDSQTWVVVSRDKTNLQFGGTGAVRNGWNSGQWNLDWTPRTMEWALIKSSVIDPDETGNTITSSFTYTEVTGFMDNNASEGEEGLGPRPYTKALLPATFSSSNGGTVNWTWDTTPGQERLQSFQLNLSGRRQSVQFHYDPNKAMLSQISQIFEDPQNPTTLLEFGYDTEHYELINSINIPERGLQLRYSYEKLQYAKEDEKVVMKINAINGAAPATAHGVGMSYFDNGASLIAWNAGDGTWTDLSQLVEDDDNQFLNYAAYTVTLAAKDNCVFRLITGAQDFISVWCVIPTDPSPWSFKMKKQLPSQNRATLLPSGLLALLYYGNVPTLQLEEWKEGDTPDKSDFVILTTVNMGGDSLPDAKKVTILDDRVVWQTTDRISWVVRGLGGKWWTSPKYLDAFPTLQSCSDFFASKFDLGPKGESKFRDAFDPYRLQVDGQARGIFQMGCYLSDPAKNVMTSSGQIYELTSAGQLVQGQSFQQGFETLTDINISKNATLDDGTPITIHFKYSPPDKDHQRYLISIEIDDHSDLNINATRQFREDNDKHDDRSILFKPGERLLYLLPQGRLAIGGPNKTEEMHVWVPEERILSTRDDPRTWDKQMLSDQAGKKFDLILSNNFEIKRTDENGPIQLFNGAKTLFDFGKNASQLMNQYPGYLVSTQSDPAVVLYTHRIGGTDVEVVEEDGIRRYVEGKYLHAQSSSQFLVSKLASGDQTKIEWTGWLPWKPTVVVSRMEIQGGPEQDVRVTRLEYTAGQLTADRDVVWSNVTMIKGNSAKESSGWTVFTFDQYKFNATSGYVRQLYDGDGNWLKQMEQNKNDTQNGTSTTQKLWDKTGSFPITTLIPFNSTECQIGYVAFQPYESWGGDCGWQFNNASVINSDDAETDASLISGNHYLSLTHPGEALTFDVPLVKGRSYLAGCWARSKALQGENSSLESPILTAWVDDQGLGFMSKVVFTRSTWNYLQVKVIAEELLPLWETLLNKKIDIDKANLTLKFRIEPSDPDFGVDVDSCLVAPLSWNSEIAVFDAKMTRVSEKVLGVSGLVVSYVYDDFLLSGEAVVTTDPMGRVTRMQFNVDGGKTGGPSVLLVESMDMPGWIHSYGTNTVPSGQTFGRYGLLHSSDDESSIDIFKDGTLPPDRFMLRFAYHLAEPKCSLTLNMQGRLITLERKGDSFSSVIRSPSGEEKKIPQIGTILIGSLPENRIFVFSSDSGVLFETDIGPATKATLSLQMSHTVAINHVIILPNPSFTLSHLSPLGEELQTAVILDDGILLKETLYDEQGRAVAATTSTHLPWSTGDMLLTYRSGWVTDFSLQSQTMAGQVVDLNPSSRGVPFTSIIFGNTPPGLNEWVGEGRPGADFSAKSGYAISYSKEGDPGAEVLFPPQTGFYYKTKVEPGGFRQISVFSESLRNIVEGNREVVVATITRSPGGWTTLVTNNFDEKGRLIATLPPMYHFQQMTLLKGKTWAEIGYDRRNAPFGIFYDYDDKDKLIRKVTPELGVSDNIYDANGKAAFVMRKTTEDDDTAGNLQRVVYFDYGDGARVSEFGVLQGCSPSGKNFTGGVKQPSKQLKYLGSVNGALSTTDFVFNYSPPEVGEAPYVQMIENHLLNKLPSSETHLSWKSSNDSSPLLTPTVRYTYTPKGDKLLKIHYATQATTLVYSYNALGFMDKVFLVRDDTEPALLANFEYSASTGGVAIERIFHTAEPPSKSLEVPPLTTNIEYNSPGYPTSWENAFFKEEISYTHPGYGDVPMGQPAYPTALTWTGTWGPAKTVTPERIAQSTGLKLSSATRCHTALIAARYLDIEGYILRRFVPVLDVENLPIICNFGEYAWGIEKLMGSVTSLRGYGYSFQYGNYKELLKAKFYDPRDVTERPYCTIPLTLTTLKNALDKPQDTVKNLWKQLGDKKYILEDSDKGRSGISHGEAGDSLLNGVQMTADLSNLIPGETLFEYAEPIGRVLGTRIGKTFGKNEFSDMFVKWQENLSNQTDVIVDTIWSMFSKQGYLDANGAVTSKVLDAGFSSIVSSIQNLDVSSVFKTLLDFFLCGVNTSAQDMQVYQSDMHGNMELFYNGQDRLNFTYKAGTNQILGSVLTLPSGENESRTYTHDINGNLNSISQDGAVLLNLTYDPLTNRPTLVKLLDGTELRFAYDYKGERVFKKVFDKNGQLVKEIRYLGRDLDRKVLTDQVLTYSSPTLPPKVVTTSYFYGPRGLFGFLRDGTYYTVLVDRIGSPRLILRNGEVVDGFNYLPYGKVSSTWKLGNVGNHGTDPILRYLFTGQELDEETGLYNFHYRMYDPTLGRFYQVDPDEQYFSPYKYAGNSPILMVDPDGRFGFLIFFIAVGLGLLFGYLGMAAANGTWDPTKWHWDKWQTWVAGIIGFVSGFLLPYGFVGTAEALVGYLGISSEAAVVLTIGLGVGGAYLSAAANFNDFNPAHWDWSSPGAWNALFNGFAFGSNIVGGVKEVFVFYDKLDSVAMKALLIGGSTFTGAGLGYISGVMANQLEDGSFQWNPAKWNVNGATFFAVVTGGLGGATLPVGLIGLKDALFGSPKEAVPFADEGQELMEMSSVRHGSISSMDTVTMVFDDSASLFSEGIEALQDTVRNDDAFIDNSFNLPYNTNNDVANFVRNTDRNLPLITFIVENLNMNLDNLIRHLGPKRARSLRLNAPINFTEPAILVFLANNDYIVLEGVGKGFHPDGGVYLFNSTSNPDLFNMLAESTGQVGTIPVGNLTVDIANFLSLRNAAAITTFMTTWGNAVRSELVKIAGVEPSLDSAAFQEEVVRRLMHAINSQPKLDLSKNEVVNWVVMTAMEGSLRDVLLNPIKEKDDNASDQLVDVLGRMGQLVAGSNIVQIIASNQTPNYTDVMLPLSERWDIPTSCVQSGEICVNGPPQVEVGSVPFLTSFKAKPENHIVPNSILSNDGLVRGMNILDMVDFTNVSHVDPLLEKLTSFDGLDGFCYFNNATSCPNKENLGNDSFENEIFVRNRVRRAAREESATSSSSSLHGSNMITRSVKLIRGLWDRISPVKPKTDKSHPTQSDILHSKTRSQNQAGSPSMWKKCVPWAHDGLGYVDGFTCMGNKGVVSVVPLSHEALETNPTSLMTTDYGDTYRDCTFYRDPTRPFGSAHCTGNKSEMHYTSWMEQRPFDHLNDHLLMVALILHFIRVSKDDEDNVKSDLISTDDEKMTMWRQTLDDIANMLEFLTIRNDADQWCSVWGRRLLQDRIDDWDTFYRKGAATLEEFEIFEEDLEALCEEVGELVDNAMKLL